MKRPVNIGILGCSRVAEFVLIQPSQRVGGVHVSAVGSRDPLRGQDYAQRNGIGSCRTYDDILGDPEIDAVYMPLPNSLHFEWCAKAIEAGKAVLCEKPLVSNEGEAKALADLSEYRAAKVAEAFHWLYHPIADRIMEIVASGVLGPLRSVDVTFLVPRATIPAGDLRFDFAHGGGSVMDVGSYCVNLIRMILGEPVDLVFARPEIICPDIDGAMEVEMRHQNDASSHFMCSHIHQGSEFQVHARLRGDHGSLFVQRPFLPQWGNYLEISAAGQVEREQVSEVPTYDFQLRDFADVVRGTAAIRTTLADAVANMRVIDEIYRSSGMKIRGI